MKQLFSTIQGQPLIYRNTILYTFNCDRLSEAYRSVFVMRSLEDMNTLETAHCLDISEEAVKVRLLRARRLLANASEEQVSNANGSAILPS